MRLQGLLVGLLVLVVFTNLHALPLHLCGNKLVETLELICKSQKYPNNQSKYSKRSADAGIIQECCISQCDLEHLKLYCQP